MHAKETSLQSYLQLLQAGCLSFLLQIADTIDQTEGTFALLTAADAIALKPLKAFPTHAHAGRKCPDA
jgi:hypothetical protein